MEEDQTLDSMTPDEPEAAEPREQRPYHTPTLTSYGGLIQLVQANPDTGMDGGKGAADCTRTA